MNTGIRSLGFTLVELMITVALVAILALVAVPAYQNQACKTRITDAKVGLMRMAQRQETFFVQNDAYSADVDAVGGTRSPEGFYTISIQNVNANGFVLAADGADERCRPGCAQITLSSTGERGPLESCWE